MYKIVVAPQEILNKPSQPVKKFDKELSTILERMEETLKATTDPKGVGLAAPQVGLPLRIFQMRPSEKKPVTSHINPVIEKLGGEKKVIKSKNTKSVEKHKPKESEDKLLEGCLSLPNIWGNVSRAQEVTLSWQDVTGKKHTRTFKGFPAVIIQHEMDHLNGTLFTSHVLLQGEKLYRSYKDKNGEDEFEEIKI